MLRFLYLLSAWFFFASAYGATKPVKIGVAGPFTGAYAMFGKQLWEGATLAAKDINAAGGINGRKIELVKGDDACEPKQAVAVANKFVEQDKVGRSGRTLLFIFYYPRVKDIQRRKDDYDYSCFY